MPIALPLALVIFVGAADAANGDTPRPLPVKQRAQWAPTVLTGKVTAVAKDRVTALEPYPGSQRKLAYTVATVEVTEGLIGADKAKVVKVGFVAPDRSQTELKEGQELILFLAKHPTADFYVVPSLAVPPIDATTGAGKKDLGSVKAVAAVLADPAKALKSDDPETRAAAATRVILKYRQGPVFGGEYEEVAIGAEESMLLLTALADGNWSGPVLDEDDSHPYHGFKLLQLSAKDGWVRPVVASAPGAPPVVDFRPFNHDAFRKWLDGPGKDYRIKKVVPRAAKK